ncbi:Wzz/FepE/Etk N-terminal domain-containing protein [uncultured Amnibacterium sp.]|uniref:Wzz/FepE/Etk N-terminal domain-containing protein n=1 Tax=uncultured Amnibacterium sp. TaxID=1631851 RepID=UPI0035CC7877
MNLHDYLRVLRRNWWVLPLVMVIGAVAAGLLTLRTPPVFQSTASALVVTPSSSIAELQLGNQFAIARAGTYAQLATTASVLDRAAATLGTSSSAEELARSVTASAQAGTAIIAITATADDPKLAAQRANAVATSLNAAVRTFDVAPASTRSPVAVQVVQAAQQNASSISASPVRNAVLGAGAGLALGIILIVLAEVLDTRVRSPRDLASTIGRLPSAIVPMRRRLGRRPSMTDSRREVFRTLRASLRPGTSTLHSVAIASVTAGRDSTEVAVELARAISESGLRVVIVDANLRPEPVRGRAGRDAGGTRPGLADVLERRAALGDVLVKGPLANMATLPPGAPSSRSAQLLSTRAMRDTVALLAESFDAVLLACPPLLARSDSAIIASIADATVTVVDARHTSRSDLVFGLEMLQGVGVENPAVILHNVRRGDMVMPSGVIATA